MDIPIATSVSIREAGFDEYWLRDQIYDNPACLNLGDLESVSKERIQSSGGRNASTTLFLWPSASLDAFST